MPLVGINQGEQEVIFVTDKDEGEFQVNLHPSEMKLYNTYRKMEDAVQLFLRRKYKQQCETIQKRVDAQNRTDR